MGLASGDVCLAEALRSETSESDEHGSVLETGPRPIAPSCAEPELRASEPAVRIGYVSFATDSGTISKMALVKRQSPRVVGRYALGAPIAAGGMATVHLGRLIGPAGFTRTVAVKRLHAELAKNPEFVQRFVDEARIASRVRHMNVVQTLDVVAMDEEVLLVLDYVHGESLARLRRIASAAGEAIPPRVAASVVVGVLRGLHAAHEAKSARGTSLDVVHRDVSPQNILVGADGVPRVIDFGIAKAAGRVHETLTRDLRGKLAYMSPEQLSGEPLDRRSDLFAAGVVLWEALAGERLFRGDDAMSTMEAIYNRVPPSLAGRFGMRAEVDVVLARALAKDARERYDTADAMARAIEHALPTAGDREVSAWVEAIAGDRLRERSAVIAAFEQEEASRPRLPVTSSGATDADRGDDGATTARRDALVPPPLGFAEAAASAEDQAPTPDREPSVTLPEADPPSSIDESLAPTPAHVPTPFTMALSTAATSAPVGSPRNPGSGATRIAPLENPRVRTPIPMPTFAAARRAPSFMQLAVLVVAPPLIVMAGLFATSSLRSTASGGAANAMSAAPVTPQVTPQAVAADDPVVAPPPPVAPPPAPTIIAPPSPPSPPATATPVASAKPETRRAHPAKAAPRHRPAPRAVPRRTE